MSLWDTANDYMLINEMLAHNYATSIRHSLVWVPFRELTRSR